jgi:hypothetical protein
LSLILGKMRLEAEKRRTEGGFWVNLKGEEFSEIKNVGERRFSRHLRQEGSEWKAELASIAGRGQRQKPPLA